MPLQLVCLVLGQGQTPLGQLGRSSPHLCGIEVLHLQMPRGEQLRRLQPLDLIRRISSNGDALARLGAGIHGKGSPGLGMLISVVLLARHLLLEVPEHIVGQRVAAGIRVVRGVGVHAAGPNTRDVGIAVVACGLVPWCAGHLSSVQFAWKRGLKSSKGVGYM